MGFFECPLYTESGHKVFIVIIIMQDDESKIV